MKLVAYYPLAKFGTVYYLPTPKGFIFYDKRTKTALLSSALAAKIHREYLEKVPEEGEWYLPKQEITIKKWACKLIKNEAIFEKAEKDVFIRMGYHYTALGRPENFWEGLLNLDPRFKVYTLAKMKIKPEGTAFNEPLPYRTDYIDRKLARLKGEFLTEKLISKTNK